MPKVSVLDEHNMQKYVLNNEMVEGYHERYSSLVWDEDVDLLER